MTLSEFVRRNRPAIDNHILSQYPIFKKIGLNDADREEWIINDEYLYLFARKFGVEV